MSDLTTVSVSVTDRCNLHCVHCGTPSAEIVAQPDPCRKDLRAVFKQISRHGAPTIIISGGEPLLRNDLTALIGDAAQYGCTCGLLTNGMFLTPRLLRELRATNAVTFIRLSVEFPETMLRPGGAHIQFHDTVQMFRTLDKIVAAGMTAGVNMTLLPGNVRYVQELAEKCRAAGAAFFRAVPVLPVGRSAAPPLPADFFEQCMAAVLSLTASSTAAAPERNAPSRKKVLSASDSFAGACPGGSQTIAIATDGSVHICPMICMEGRSISCFEQPLDACIAYALRRKKHLQQIMTASGKNGCAGCRQVSNCKCGCIAEWYARRRQPSVSPVAGNGQPCCYKKTIRGLLRRSSFDAAMMNTVLALSEKIDILKMLYGNVACLRSLPLWTVRFTER